MIKNRMSIKIRKYQNKDKEQLIETMNNFQDYLVAIDDMKRIIRLPTYGKEYVKKTLKELKECHGVLYVGENEEKKIVGIGAGIIRKPTKISRLDHIPTKAGQLTELYVAPEYRGKNLGKLLIQAVESYFIEKKCTVIVLEVLAVNHQAYEFYKRSGYKDRDYTMIKVLVE